jgi:hypothetical protein
MSKVFLFGLLDSGFKARTRVSVAIFVIPLLLMIPVLAMTCFLASEASATSEVNLPVRLPLWATLSDDTREIGMFTLAGKMAGLEKSRLDACLKDTRELSILKDDSHGVYYYSVKQKAEDGAFAGALIIEQYLAKPEAIRTAEISLVKEGNEFNFKLVLGQGLVSAGKTLDEKMKVGENPLEFISASLDPKAARSASAESTPIWLVGDVTILTAKPLEAFFK